MGYEPHAKMTEPEDDTRVWRYMDLGKYLDLLSTESVAMPKATKMRDPYEGEIGAYNRAYTFDHLPDDERQKVTNVREVTSLARGVFRDYTFMSCWHAAEHESAGMWSLYSDEDKGVAVVSTWGQLKASLKADLRIHGGMVQYLDYDTSPVPENNMLSIYCYKRISFEHEREVRLLVQDVAGVSLQQGAMDESEAQVRRHGLFESSQIEGVVRIPVELSVLVGEVRVSPTAQPWFVNAVTNVSAKYGGTWPVMQSSLYQLR